MNDRHQGTHNGLAPGCLMWAPIIPLPAPAESPVSVADDKAGSRPPINDGVSAEVSDAGRNVSKT